jgi:hypothetical protein
MTTSNEASDAWRPLVAALANDDALETYARMILGASAQEAMEPVPAKKRARVLASLRAAGLVADGQGEADAPVVARPFAALLASAPVAPRASLDRFIVDGRLDRYPMNADDRLAVLTWIANHALYPGEELTEVQVNERLKVFTRDYVTLRRYLVDAELLERTRSGSSYALVDD